MTRSIPGFAALAFVLLAGSARDAFADDLVTKKMLLKDNTNAAKRQIQVLSTDPLVTYAGADSPGTKGASIHVYSGTDAYCLQLVAGAEWTDNGKFWKYKNSTTKNLAQIGNKKLSVKIKSGIPFTLLDDGEQGTVSVQAQFGELGTVYCMTCSGALKDQANLFLGKNCIAAPCPAEPSPCEPVPTTTTSTTMPPAPGAVRGALTPTSGRFNYNLTLGIAGATAACHSSFPNSHPCSYQELQDAVAGGSMTGLKDTANTTVTSFWAIDPLRSDFDQCTVSVPWDYNTLHTGHKADTVSLDNPTGTLGTLQTGQACGASRWVACCQD
jgi:hypothetical protein